MTGPHLCIRGYRKCSAAGGGLATTAELLTMVTRGQLAGLVKVEAG